MKNFVENGRRNFRKRRRVHTTHDTVADRFMDVLRNIAARIMMRFWYT